MKRMEPIGCIDEMWTFVTCQELYKVNDTIEYQNYNVCWARSIGSPLGSSSILPDLLNDDRL